MPPANAVGQRLRSAQAVSERSTAGADAGGGGTELRHSVAGRGLVTAAGLAVVNAGAAIAAIVIAHRFGRTPQTDGLFAAYAVYLVLALSAQATRTVVLPSLTRARAEGRLAAEALSYAVAIAAVAFPLLAIAVAVPQVPADAVTAGGAGMTAAAAAEAIPWLVAGGVGHLFAALLASALATFDRYAISAGAYSLGVVAALAVFFATLNHGPVALAFGLAANSLMTVTVLAIALLRRAAPIALVRPARVVPRAVALGRGVALPLALQAFFVVAARLATGEGVGEATTLSYAYIAASVLVNVTAIPLALASSVPLTRRSLSTEHASDHVVSASWISMPFVALAAGIAAVLGRPVTETLLGDAFAAGSATDLGRLVVALGPWMVFSIALAAAYPLLFIAGPVRLIPLVGALALALHVPLEFLLGRAFGTVGIALGLGASTLAVLCSVLGLLGMDVLRSTLVRVAAVGLLFGGGAVVAFAVSGALADASATRAAVGAALYLLLVRAAWSLGLRRAWSYAGALR